MDQTTTRVTFGMDVSDKHCHLAVLDDSGQVIARERIATKEPALRRWFGRWRGQTVILEVGPHSLWMSRVLGETNTVILANPTRVALIHGVHTKNDRVDAETLARLGRADPQLLAPIQHRRAETQADLAAVRSRHALVRARTSLINSVKGQAKAAGGSLTGGSSASFHERTDELPELVAEALLPLMAAIGSLTERIKELDARIDALCREDYPETGPMLRIPGVGPVTALQFVLTLEDPERFPSSRAVGSYLGLRPGQDQSGDSDPGMRITKAGDPLLRRNLIQCAHRILGPHGGESELRTWGVRLAERGGKGAYRKATVAIARKLAILLHRLWITGEEYEPFHAQAA
jgi:transposase